MKHQWGLGHSELAGEQFMVWQLLISCHLYMFVDISAMLVLRGIEWHIFRENIYTKNKQILCSSTTPRTQTLLRGVIDESLCVKFDAKLSGARPDGANVSVQMFFAFRFTDWAVWDCFSHYLFGWVLCSWAKGWVSLAFNNVCIVDVDPHFISESLYMHLISSLEGVSRWTEEWW